MLNPSCSWWHQGLRTREGVCTDVGLSEVCGGRLARVEAAGVLRRYIGNQPLAECRPREGHETRGFSVLLVSSSCAFVMLIYTRAACLGAMLHHITQHPILCRSGHPGHGRDLAGAITEPSPARDTPVERTISGVPRHRSRCDRDKTRRFFLLSVLLPVAISTTAVPMHRWTCDPSLGWG